MKILLISDIEGRKVDLPESEFDNVSLILIPGDLTIGAVSPKRINKEIEKLSRSFPSDIDIYFIPGNRDTPHFIEDPVEYPSNIHMIHDKVIEVPPLIIAAFGGAKPGLNNTLVFSEEVLYSHLWKLFIDAHHIRNQIKSANPNRKPPIILMVHDPPYNTKVDLTFRGTHVGSQSVRKIIEEFQPELVVCGHIHESANVDRIGESIIVNPGDWKSRKSYSIINIIDSPEDDGSYRIDVEMRHIES